MGLEKPLLVEIVAHAPTAFYHCTHCELVWSSGGISDSLHNDQKDTSLPPDLAEDYRVMNEWVGELFRQHCDGLVVKVIDAVSLEGLYKTLRYGLHRYPAVIVDGKQKFGKQDLAEAAAAVSRFIGQQAPA